MPLHHQCAMGELRLLAHLLAAQSDSTSACPNDVGSGDRGEAWWLHLFRDQLDETGFLEERLQIVHTTPASGKARGAARSFLLVRKIGDDQPPPRFEYAGDFGESLAFEWCWQMVDHQGGEDDIER